MSPGAFVPQSSSLLSVAGRAAIPRGVWVLGCVSLLMDVSSELAHSLLPLFLAGTLGVPVLAIGLIEGVAEATALICKVFSGALSDWLGKRKPLVLLGYGLAAFSKPLFPLADSASTVLFARFVDRVGKGVRGAPRDALIADITPPAIRGAAFGLRQSMDTVGAVLGPLLAIALMFVYRDDIRSALWWSLPPALLAVAAIWLWVREPAEHGEKRERAPMLNRAALSRFSAGFWGITALGAVFTLARFSEAFLVLRGAQLGLPLAWAPLVMVAMSASYALSAYPLGWLSDRVSRARLLQLSLLLLIAADLALGAASGPALLLAGALLWGLHLGCSQGLLSALVAQTAPAGLAGSAFGLFNLVCGLATLLASVVAGALWQEWGAAATFHGGAVFAAAAWLLGLVLRPLRQF
ncbi:MFS transporter [Chromobacterium subtsugae]|uniref:MFS transporter n=1 Tax=Chromobacterium subtsugae TaxID=251747 RepID=A0ABS7FIX6_9NEIS|nr:MFS transporter [Chromobacterium subtsugae]KUM04736.1 MFS transporter [Chromobacterium subtsugae]KZE84776.1 MFS transporter [Chromobacterium sp. F49]MBW7568143.1 MFS transporter [Chromobacterium subtsugae]MBW8289254.1 MFS transporter [Chromobacterium subtsugae]